MNKHSTQLSGATTW